VLHRIALLAIAAPRRVLGVAALLMVGAAVFGVPVAKTCQQAVSGSCFGVFSSDCAAHREVRSERRAIAVHGDCARRYSWAAARAAGWTSSTRSRTPYVADVVSPWTSPPAPLTCSVRTADRA